MGFLDKFKEKTIADVVDTAKEKVSDAAKTVTQNKVEGVLTILPLVATACIIFAGNRDDRRDRGYSEQTIINNYYYGERQVKKNVSNNCESGK